MNLVIFGAGDFARLVCHYCGDLRDVEVCAFTVHQKYIAEDSFCGKPVVPFEQMEKTFPPSSFKMFCAVGYRKMRDRKIVYDQILEKGYDCINIVHPQAVVSIDLIMGKNNIIMPAAHLEPFVKIGSNNIVWSDSLICHDSRIGDHNFIAAGSILGGGCNMENSCFIGFNTTIVQNRFIANETLTGANSLIFCDTEPCSKYFGVPAVKHGSHEQDGICIKE
jgi:UDP-N-acetylbacillosamine N-acetyltransferase